TALIAGWVMTAFAVTLGAPFWFDILSKLMTVRSTFKGGSTPPSTPLVPPGSTEETLRVISLPASQPVVATAAPAALAAPAPVLAAEYDDGLPDASLRQRDY
ncbi:MAG: hypothetical protein QM667_04485, partial [Asticcacaulis sp.]